MAYDRLSTYKTEIVGMADGSTAIYYRNTCIVQFTPKSVRLYSGGWQTVTTKRKMNQASHQFDLGYGVFQRNYVWFVTLPNGETVEFEDNMKFSRIQEAA